MADNEQLNDSDLLPRKRFKRKQIIHKTIYLEIVQTVTEGEIFSYWRIFIFEITQKWEIIQEYSYTFKPGSEKPSSRNAH